MWRGSPSRRRAGARGVSSGIAGNATERAAADEIIILSAESVPAAGAGLRGCGTVSDRRDMTISGRALTLLPRRKQVYGGPDRDYST